MEVILYYLAFNIIFALFAGAISEYKGRDRMAGFFWGLLLGLIGLIIVLCHPRTEKAELRDGKRRKCPSCAELIKIEALKCRYCGETFTVADLQ